MRIAKRTDQNQKIAAIDIGNTTAAYGIYGKGRFTALGRVSTDEFSKIICVCMKNGINSDSIWMMSSVVPKITRKLVSLIKSKFKPAPASIYIIGINLNPPVPMRYARKQLGADRLVNIYGAIKKRRLPALVIDFGTAITFDYVSKKGIFEGGLIVPGVELSGYALQEKTALLPKLNGFKPSGRELPSTTTAQRVGLPGRDTRSAMVSGLLNGFGALADGMIERFRRRYGSGLRVLATGGWARRLSAYTRHIRAGAVDPLHTLRSLVLIYQNEVERKRKRGR